MFEKIKLLFLMITLMLLAGCAVGQSVIDIAPDVSKTSQPAPSSDGKSVYINSVNDKRVFEVDPPIPETPSLDPSEASSDSIKQRAIGRKRGGFGKAFGNILLKEDESITGLMTSAIRQAFIDKGYAVLDKPEQVMPDTYVVDAEISKFWAWMNPGFFAITLSAEISTDMSIKSGEKTQKLTVQVKSAGKFQTGMKSNYIEVISNAIKLYVDDLKNKLQ
ncbi:MAG: hypothetical protein LBV44_04920 [Methylobacillus sp.]|jgi:uncharacterized lipoprotein YajG|nr:hypothetical protein [Methylobacillus sp.]